MFTKEGNKALNLRSFTNDIQPFVYIAIGSSDKPLSDQDNKLDKEIFSEGMSRKLANIEILENGDIILSAEFECNEKTVIAEQGIFNSAFDGIMLTREIVGSFNVAPGVVYKAKFKLSFNS